MNLERDIVLEKKINEILPRNASQEQVEQVKKEAKDILDGKSNIVNPEFSANVREAAMFVWRIGLPGVLEYLKYLVNNSECPKKEMKDKCLRKINKLSKSLGDTDELIAGCMEYKIKTTQNSFKTVRAHIGLCSKDHDLTKEMIKIDSVLPKENFEENNKAVLRSLGELVFYSRQVWQQVIHREQKMAVMVQDIIANQYSENVRKGLMVDKENTTLYIDPTLDKRLGIFISVD